MTNVSSNLDLAVAITTKNNMRTIERTLRSVQPIASRIVVVDSGSTDGTIERCQALGAELIHKSWAGHIAQKQFAIDQCRDQGWIMLLDSDESLEAELIESIGDVVLEDDPIYDGWAFNRKVWFLGGWLHHTFQPEWRLRLFRSGRGRVTGIGVHDQIEVPGRTRRLKGICRHDSWSDVRDLALRQIAYAEEAVRSGIRGGSTFNLLLSPPAAMFKQLILKRAFLDGFRGLIAAGMTFNYTMLKHSFIAAERLSKRR
ncbi:MAG: glycosyltransferase family 2 protein [Planctomycetes bacterium]|nr:glycosyltransferase family 2 protein [Planctomycetota bacterium]